jgi:hypothetical protein
VASKRWILFLLPAAMLSGLAACGGGSTANVQNPAAPAAATVSIAFQSAPSGSIAINTTASLTAVVTNDPNNSGVDWSLTCSTTNTAQNACGTISAPHTASGTAITYTPPASFSGNSLPVNIVAYATADHTQNVDAPMTITAFGSNLKGSYVLEAQGVDENGPENYQFAGVIVLDGNGGVSSGEQTINFIDLNPNISAFVSKSDAITGGSYFLGPDGRGTIVINTNDTDIGYNGGPGSGTETFAFVFLNSSQALITQADSTGVSASGTMDAQTWTASSAPLSRGYAFVVSGSDFNSGSPTAMGGILNIDSLPNNPNNISGAGSAADQNLAGTTTPNQSLSGTVSSPDPSGAVTLNLTVPNFQSTNSFTFTGYIVDGTRIKLIENDNSSGFGIGSTAGIALSQGSATGTFSDASLSGTYVFGILGVDLDGFSPASLTWAGEFTADGMGNLTGFNDTFLQQNFIQPPNYFGAQISGSFTTVYESDSRGAGRFDTTFTHFSPHPNPPYNPKLYIYLTGNGNPALILDASDTTASINYPSLGVGIVYPQSTGALTFSGDYGFSFTQFNGSENDGSGQLTANSSAGTLSGAFDVNSSFNPTFGNLLSGTFQAPVNGRFSGTLSGPTLDVSPFAADFFIIDPNHGFFVETDLANPNDPTGVVSFGYYASRTPVCPTCP